MAEKTPLSRRHAVVNIRPDGLAVSVVPTETELAAIATYLSLPAVRKLTGDFIVRPKRKGGITVTGSVFAEIVQTCVLTLDEFEQRVTETAELDFIKRPETVRADLFPGEQNETFAGIEELDQPDYIDDGEIDFGALTVEFLSLGLDPYPQKPGSSFEFKDQTSDEDKPFASLAAIKKTD